MKTRAIHAVLCLALFFALSCPAAAVDVGVSFVIDGVEIEKEIATQTVNQTVYVSYWPIVEALYPDAQTQWANGQAEVRAEGLELFIKPQSTYLVANGRYLYVPDGVACKNSSLLVPVRVLCRALGATVRWNSGTVYITSGSGPITPGGQAYPQDSLYWLSRIIYAESGNQPLAGKIAVGNVVLNRVNSPAFPNSVYAVVFQQSQFTPVMNGTIYSTPNAESVIAAKLCLDGANTVGDALYFVNPRATPGSWAYRNRPHVATIGAHAFFA